MSTTDNDPALIAAMRWNDHVSLAYRRAELERHVQQTDSELLAAVRRAGGRVTLPDGRVLVIREYVTHDYDADDLNLLCLRWLQGSAGTFARQVEACRKAHKRYTVEVEV